MIDQIIETTLKAGNVIYFILLVSIYAWFLIIAKYFFLRKEFSGNGKFFNTINEFIIRKDRKSLREFLGSQGKLIAGCIGSISESKNKTELDRKSVQERLFYFERLNSNMGTLATLASLAPLLGLLGTVTGMMRTFELIKLFGSSNPAIMADGISEALLTTQAGLVVAFPLVLASAYLKHKIKDLQDNFEKVYVKLRGQYNA